MRPNILGWDVCFKKGWEFWTTTKLHSTAASSVVVMYRSSGPNTGSNSGGQWILKKRVTTLYLPSSMSMVHTQKKLGWCAHCLKCKDLLVDIISEQSQHFTLIRICRLSLTRFKFIFFLLLSDFRSSSQSLPFPPLASLALSTSPPSPWSLFSFWAIWLFLPGINFFDNKNFENYFQFTKRIKLHNSDSRNIFKGYGPYSRLVKTSFKDCWGLLLLQKGRRRT